MKRVCLAVVALATLAAGARDPAWATVRIAREAVSLRYPAGNCSYCHTFDSDHMRQRAKEAGLAVRGLECAMCHGHELRTGARVLNLRGLWLLGRKRKLGAPRVDPAWLSEFRAPATVPRPSPTPPAKRPSPTPPATQPR
jgi:mono/diheme cytochrome c family protein